MQRFRSSASRCRRSLLTSFSRLLSPTAVSCQPARMRASFDVTWLGRRRGGVGPRTHTATVATARRRGRVTCLASRGGRVRRLCQGVPACAESSGAPAGTVASRRKCASPAGGNGDGQHRLPIFALEQSAILTTLASSWARLYATRCGPHLSQEPDAGVSGPRNHMLFVRLRVVSVFVVRFTVGRLTSSPEGANACLCH